MTHPSDDASGLTRREFFRSIPGKIFDGFQGLRNLGAVTHEPQALKARHGERARLDISRCLAWGGMTCQLCYLSCPLRDKAIMMEDAKPVVFSQACNGCGICVDACRSVNDPPSLTMKEKGEKPIE